MNWLKRRRRRRQLAREQLWETEWQRRRRLADSREQSLREVQTSWPRLLAAHEKQYGPAPEGFVYSPQWRVDPDGVWRLMEISTVPLPGSGLRSYRPSDPSPGG